MFCMFPWLLQNQSKVIQAQEECVAVSPYQQGFTSLIVHRVHGFLFQKDTSNGSQAGEGFQSVQSYTEQALMAHTQIWI